MIGSGYNHIDFSSVSSAVGFAAGVLAGSVSFKAVVELFENSPEKRICVRIYGTTSNSCQGVFGASTNHQTDHVVKICFQDESGHMDGEQKIIRPCIY
jgi:hypothetical protein